MPGEQVTAERIDFIKNSNHRKVVAGNTLIGSSIFSYKKTATRTEPIVCSETVTVAAVVEQEIIALLSASQSVSVSGA